MLTKEEVRQRIRSTDVTDERKKAEVGIPMEVGRRKKAEVR
ncbi:hypothetical protein [Microcoleus sp. herbarium14]